MDEFKKIWESKALWGVVVMLATPVAKKFGFDLGDINTWVPDVMTFFGAALAIYGRIKAVKRIG